MNILISGVSGYLGSNIKDYLSANGDTISIVDKNYIIQNKQVSYDVFLYFSNPNEISFSKGEKDSVESMINHFYSIKNILEHIKVKSIFYASTVRVYDENKNIYALTHLFMEGLLSNYTVDKSIKLSILRFGNIFGGSIESMLKRDTLVPHTFIKSALENNKIELHTNGHQYRDFTPIALVNKYIDYIIENHYEIVDITTGINFQIKEVVDIIVNQFPQLSLIINNKDLNEKVKVYNPILEFSKNDIEEEILLTINQWRDYYDSNIK